METQENPAVYFASLSLENLKCFKGEHNINLSTPEGKPAMWTVILGNNNTGKTTILRALANFEPTTLTKKADNRIMYVPISILRKNKTSFLTKNEIESKVKVDVFVEQHKTEFSYTSVSAKHNERLKNIFILGYGVTRKSGEGSTLTLKQSRNTDGLFLKNMELLNVEEWLLQLHLAFKNDSLKAYKQLEKIKQVLVGKKILPDVIDFKVISNQEPPFDSYVLFHTDFGKVRLQDLGYGYQSMLSWLVDFMYSMFLRYPNSENPLAEPAIVLLDEIDLHLHPDWQRKIIKFLSDIFPKTQFIVTAHSPLIVQSAENINVVMLKKEGENITIEPHRLTNFQGWTVDEILDELMDMDDKTMSERYLALMHQFNEGMDEENYPKTKEAFDELDQMLHSRNAQRKLLRLQMTSLPHPDDTTAISA